PADGAGPPQGPRLEPLLALLEPAPARRPLGRRARRRGRRALRGAGRRRAGRRQRARPLHLAPPARARLAGALTRRLLPAQTTGARIAARRGRRPSPAAAPVGIEGLVVFWGALRAGVIVNPINVEIREKHVAQILHDVAPKAVFWSRELASDPRALGTGGAPWFAFGPWNAPAPPADDLFGRLRSASDAPVGARPARAGWSLIDYTSGTTDTPKGAIWTHEAYYAMCESPVDRLELGEADTILDYRHFSWSSPQILSIGPTMLTGATL